MILKRRKKPPRDSSEARDALINAALRIIQDPDRQFDARAVAGEAGRSLGTLTFHFREKGLWELREAVAAKGFDMLARASREAGEAPGTPEERLRSMARAYVRFASEHPRLYLLMWADQWGPTVERGRQAVRAVAHEQIARCQEAGLFRPVPVERFEYSGQALLHGIAVLHLEGQISHDNLDRYVEGALDDLFDGFRLRD
jgi:AcrR family transcriptional regulator